MRTVTFSNDEVAKAVNDKFVATWVNREPGFHSCDNAEERKIVRNDFEAFATKNFCTFFTTPDLEVLHYASGHYYPPLFLGELAFAREVADAVTDKQGKFRPAALGRYLALHEAHAKEHNQKAVTLRSMKPPKGDRETQQQFMNRRESYAEGMTHLKAVHVDLAGKAGAGGRLIPLEDVFHRYLHGNSFEETKRTPDK